VDSRIIFPVIFCLITKFTSGPLRPLSVRNLPSSLSVNFSNAAIGAQKKRIEEVSRFSPFPFLLIWRDGGKQLARRREEKNYEISKKKKKKITI